MHEQDTIIVDKLKNGDLSAYDALFTKYYPALCLNAYFFLKDDEDAKDIVQALFIDIWEKKLYLFFHHDVKGYLYRAVKNKCLNHLDKQKNRQKKHEAFTELQQHNDLHDENAADHYRRLQSGLEGMAAQKRKALEMIYIKGSRYKEAADEMGISINSFKTHLKSGLKILRYGIKNNKSS